MSYIPYSFPLTGGLDRSVAPLRADKAGFYTLQNLRQPQNQRGCLEPTPRFRRYGTLTPATYWNGTSVVSESSVIPVIFWDATFGFAFTTLTARFLPSQEKVPVYDLTSFVSDDDSANTGVLLVVTAGSTPPLDVGETLEVQTNELDEFRYRIAGGAWSAFTAITPGTRQVLGSTQFAITFSVSPPPNSAWTWRRTDNCAASAAMVRVNDRVFYLGWDKKLRVLEKSLQLDPADTEFYYIRLVSPLPIYGNDLQTFEDHLLVYGASHTASQVPSSVLFSSDLLAFDVFEPTDVNEAEIKDFLLETPFGYSTGLRVYTGAIVQGRLYVFTNAGIYFTDYLGLPLVYSFKRLLPLDGSLVWKNAVTTRFGVFLSTSTTLYLFDGAQLQRLHEYIIPSVYRLFQNDTTDELLVLQQGFGTILVYQQQHRTFYTRRTNFALNEPFGISVNSSGGLNLGVAGMEMLYEDLTYQGTTSDTVPDNNTSFATPLLVTQLLGETLSIVKDSAPVFIGVLPGGAAGSAYVSLQAVLGWQVADSGMIANVSFETHADAVWNISSPNGQISFPRTPYRAIAFQLVFSSPTAGRAPTRFLLTAIETMIRVADSR